MHTPGPLPKDALTKRPEQLLAEVKAAKVAAIIAGHEAALAGAVALSDPTPSTVAVEAGLLAASDPEGLELCAMRWQLAVTSYWPQWTRQPSPLMYRPSSSATRCNRINHLTKLFDNHIGIVRLPTWEGCNAVAAMTKMARQHRASR